MSKLSKDASMNGREIRASALAGGSGAAEPDELERMRRRRERRAREELVLRLLPLAYEVAGRYRSTGRPYETLVRVAQLGLVRAAERYDGRTDPLVARYALKTIRAELDSFLDDAPGCAEAELRTRHAEAAQELVSRLLSRRSHLRELAAELEIDPTLVAAGLLAAAARGHVPLFEPGRLPGPGTQSRSDGDSAAA